MPAYFFSKKYSKKSIEIFEKYLTKCFLCGIIYTSKGERITQRTAEGENIMKNTWKKIYGYEVYVDENGRITHGMSNGCTTYVYRVCRTGGYDKEDSITEAAFRAGVRRGTIKMA